jgi:hypothetical protein
MACHLYQVFRSTAKRGGEDTIVLGMSGNARNIDSNPLDASLSSQLPQSRFDVGGGESAAEVRIRKGAHQFGQNRLRDDQIECLGSPAT